MITYTNTNFDDYEFNFGATRDNILISTFSSMSDGVGLIYQGKAARYVKGGGNEVLLAVNYEDGVRPVQVYLDKRNKHADEVIVIDESVQATGEEIPLNRLVYGKVTDSNVGDKVLYGGEWHDVVKSGRYVVECEDGLVFRFKGTQKVPYVIREVNYNNYYEVDVLKNQIRLLEEKIKKLERYSSRMFVKCNELEIANRGYKSENMQLNRELEKYKIRG